MTSDASLRPEDDMLAAEYALGTLPHAERQAFIRRIAAEPALAACVAAWEVRLSGLAEDVDPAQPPPAAKGAIHERLFPGTPQVARAGFWASVNLWRGLAAVALAALVVLAALHWRLPSGGTSQSYVAEIADKAGQFKLVAFYDARDQRLKLNLVNGAASPGHSLELWLIEGGNKPVSLGVLPPTAAAQLQLPAGTAALLKSAVLAVSDEPAGGSPTGQPTGPVLGTGEVSEI